MPFNMKPILVILIFDILVNTCICNIIVFNKLNRQKIVTIQHDLLISGLGLPLLKVQLHFVQLSETCSIPKIPKSKLYTVHSTNASRQTVLVIQQDSHECDISENITRAKKSGYAGIIFCTDAIVRFRHLKPTDGFYASVILNNDRFSLSKFDSTRYKISIFRDTCLSEDLFEYFRILLEWITASLRPATTGIQILLLLTPIFVLLAANFSSSKRHYNQYYEPFHSQDQSYHWEYEDEDESASNANDKTLEFREILNVGCDAGRREIERAFRYKALVLHPDKNVNVDEEERLKREEELKRCNTAKEALLEALLKKSDRLSI